MIFLQQKMASVSVDIPFTSDTREARRSDLIENAIMDFESLKIDIQLAFTIHFESLRT